MFKRFVILLAVCFTLLLPHVVYADIIMPPERNDFYFRHRDEFVPLGRDFFANGENGFVSVKEEPGSEVEIAVINNNEVLYIQYTYDYKGETWGFIKRLGRVWIIGWVPMDQLLFHYDSISFTEEHKSLQTSVSGDQVINNIPASNPIPQPENGQLAENTNKSGPSVHLLVILVALLAVSTDVLIRVFWKPNKSA